MIPSPSPQKTVSGLGQACLDTLGIIERYPPVNTKCEFSGLLVQGGGPAATALVTLSRLGVPTAFAGKVSDDPAGKSIISGLEDEGVDTTHLLIDPGKVSHQALIMVERDSGTRTIFWFRGSPAPLSPSEVEKDFVENACFLHLDGLMLEASLSAARIAKARAIPVMLDSGTLREGIIDLCREVTYLLVSETFARSFRPGEKPEKCLEVLAALGPEEVVITMGERGAVGMGTGSPCFQPAFRVPVVDTTGAGDVFHGAYIYGILQGWEIGRRLEFASAAAALSCTKLGGRTAIPDLPSLELFLEGSPPVRG